MTVKEAIEYIISESKKDESLLTDTNRFKAYLSDLAPEYKEKGLNVVKKNLDSDFLEICFNDKEDVRRRVSRIKYRLEKDGLAEHWIDFIIDSFFTPLGWKPPKDEEETSQTQKQQTQNQQTQNQQTQNQQTQNQQTQKQQTQKQQTQKQQTQQTKNQQTQNQNLGKFGVIAILIFVGICILTIIFSNSNNNDIKEPAAYSTIETTNKSYNQTETKEITLSNVGDYIKFGSYPQTAEGEEQPIEWLVLSKENNEILVISRYGLDVKRFDRSSNIWANSEICKWLNTDFYNKAFSDSEKKYINSSYLSDVGTIDYVFLLSKEDAEKYFANANERRCRATEYAVKNGAYVNSSNGYSYWWLRSLSLNHGSLVYCVNFDGNIFNYNYVDYDYILVRPALFINL